MSEEYVKHRSIKMLKTKKPSFSSNCVDNFRFVPRKQVIPQINRSKLSQSYKSYKRAKTEVDS